jgi:hypothetical protein
LLNSPPAPGILRGLFLTAFYKKVKKMTKTLDWKNNMYYILCIMEVIMTIKNIVTLSFRTGFKNYIDLVSKNEGLTLTQFVNDCIRERLAQKTDFLAAAEASKIMAGEMGMPEIASTSLEKLRNLMSKEAYSSYIKKWGNHYDHIKGELEAFFSDDGVLGPNGEIVEAPIII